MDVPVPPGGLASRSNYRLEAASRNIEKEVPTDRDWVAGLPLLALAG